MSESSMLPTTATSVAVAIYVRRSTDDEHQPYSLESQLTRLHAYIASQPGWVLVDTFRDDASAATTNRPGLQAALSAAWSKRFDLLLVYRLDRFTRRIRDLAALTEELDTAGVAFRSATEPFDTSTPAGRMMVQMLAVFAEFEREILIDRVINGLERKAARGQWAGGVPPYGYRIDPDTDKLVAHLDEAPILREIFDLYVSTRVGTRAVATTLNERGLRTRTGQPWSGIAVARMLANRVYLGELNYRTISVPGAHPPLIDAGTHAEAQRIFASRGGVRVQRAGSQSDYHLTGLIICPECGQKYVGTSAHGRHRVYRYYTCARRSRYGPIGCTAC
jgi:site-specific DNA recombinase